MALAVMAVPTYSKVKDKVREVRTMEEIRGLEKGVLAYSIDKGGTLPANLAALGIPIQADPWGNPYQYFRVPTDAPPRLDLITPLNDDFDLYSMGPDGLTAQRTDDPKSLDDIVRSGDGTFVGMAPYP